MKEYTLQATLHTGTRGSNWGDTDWGGFFDGNPLYAGTIGKGGSTGKDWFATNFIFDADELAALRTKNITSVVLRVTCNKWNTSVTSWPVGWKRDAAVSGDNTSQAWRRTGTQISAGTLTKPSGITPSGDEISPPIVISVPLNTTLPSVGKEGYTIGPPASTLSNNSYFVVTAAELVVTTDEVTEFTVMYDHGETGTGTNTADTKNAGEPITLKGAIFTRLGYEQTGWSTTDGGAKEYDLGESYTDDADVTLYPVWAQITGGGIRYKGSDGVMHVGTIWIKGTDGNMHQGTAYMKGTDGNMHEGT